MNKRLKELENDHRDVSLMSIHVAVLCKVL